MPPGLASVRHLARHQIMGLVSVFLLGMAVNLTGLPSQTSGGAHLASIAFLAAHALIAPGLIIGHRAAARAAARLGGQWRRRAVAGAAAIAVAAGILTRGSPAATGGPTSWRWALSPRCWPTAACSCQRPHPRTTARPLPRRRYDTKKRHLPAAQRPTRGTSPTLKASLRDDGGQRAPAPAQINLYRAAPPGRGDDPLSRPDRRFAFPGARGASPPRRDRNDGETHASYRRHIPELTGSAWDIEAEADRRIDHAGLRLGTGGRPVGHASQPAESHP